MIKGYKSQILKEYDKVRELEVTALKERKKEIAKELPQVINLQEKIAKLSIDMSIGILKHPQNASEYINKIKEQITDLRIKKSELLVSKNYPIDYLELHYQCAKCKDTGFTNNARCSCYKKKLSKLYYKTSDLSTLLKSNNFNNFNFNYYPDTPMEFNSKITIKQNMKEIVSKALFYIKNFHNSDENFMFMGNPGTGKTFLSHCIAKELLDKGYLVIYRTSDELIENLREIRFKHNKQLEDIILNCDLLIIDDLGTEQINDFSRTELFNLLNKKLLLRKNMIISTNFTLESLLETYSERISSRLLGNFTLCKFYCKDIRIQNNIKR